MTNATIASLLACEHNPCLFYPAIKDVGYDMADVLRDADKQVEVLRYIEKNYIGGAVIRMTELWCEGASFGLDVSFSNHDFPSLGDPLCEDAEDLANIAIPDAVNAITAPLIQAVERAVPFMEKPLIVGITGPYTLGAVLNGSEDFMCNCLSEEDLVFPFLDKLTDFLISYTLAYKQAGASAVMIAEPSVAMISPDMMLFFSNAYIEKIIHAVADESFAVIYHNCGAVNPHLSNIATLPADAFHFGNDVDLSKALALFSPDQIIMGNIDPQHYITQKTPALQTMHNTLHNAMSQHANFSLSTGCDLSPKANVDIFRK